MTHSRLHPYWRGTGPRFSGLTPSTVTNVKYLPSSIRFPVLAWSAYETSAGVFSSGVENNLDSIITDAHNRDYQIALELQAGWQAPSWLYSHGCAKITLFENDEDTVGQSITDVPVPWDTHYRTHWQSMLAHMGTWMQGACPGGGNHHRSRHFYYVAGFGFTSDAEMALGYGNLGTYLPSSSAPTVKTAINASVLTIDVTGGTQSDFHTGKQLLKIGSGSGSDPTAIELVYVTSAVLNSPSAGDIRFTVATAGRGFSGTSAASWGVGTQVRIANDSDINDSIEGDRTTQVTIGGVTGIFDHQIYNKWVWDQTGKTQAQRQASIVTVWENLLDDYASNLPQAVRIQIAGGWMFNDAYDGADAVLEYLGAAYGSRLVVMTTNFQPNYSVDDPNGHAFLLRAGVLGCTVGTTPQADSSGAWGTAGTDAYMQAYIDSFEAGKITYGFEVIRIGSNRWTTSTYATTSSGGWPGRNPHVFKDWLSADHESIQARIG